MTETDEPLSDLYEEPPYLVQNADSRKWHIYSGGESCACGNVDDFTVTDRRSIDNLESEGGTIGPADISKTCWQQAKRFHLCMSCGKLRSADYFEDGDCTCRICYERENADVAFREADDGEGYVLATSQQPVSAETAQRIRDTLIKTNIE